MAGMSNKLTSANWQGPYKVIKSTGGVYDLFDPTNNKTLQAHVAQLKSYQSSPDPAQAPELHAFKNKGLTPITTCLDIRGHQTNNGEWQPKSRWEVLIKWTDEINPKWEPWGNVKSTDAVHKYLTEKGWEQHIPKSFRPENVPVKRSRKYPIPVDSSSIERRDQHKRQWDKIHEGITRRISQRIKQKKGYSNGSLTQRHHD
jgi:hypothetical protein